MVTPGGAALREVLERCRSEAGYTPPLRCLPALLQHLAESREDSVPIERAIARAGPPALAPTLTLLGRVPPAQRPRLLELLARLASGLVDPEPRGALCAALTASLEESVGASRKWAARGLAKLGAASSEAALLRALERAPAAEQKSLVDALGAVGTTASVAVLRALAALEPDLVRRRERALALIERRLLRGSADEILLDRALEVPCRVLLFCRAGLVELLSEELRGLGFDPRPVASASSAHAVEVEHRGTLTELLAARTAFELGLRLDFDASHADPVARLSAALTEPHLLASVQRWTQGVPRFRVAWTDGGHLRARVWALAHALRQRGSVIVNDSQRALWTLRARSDASGEAALVPRIEPDPRFSYRVRDVPAASHPSIAAALARAAGVEPDEVVWDPFVGSALELIERARLGPVRELWGSDVDPRALAAARENLAAAGYSAQLAQRSAIEFAPKAVSLILTNPPMGRRVARDGSLGELLQAFVQHAARVLRPGGRLVWLSPLSAATERWARERGLSVSNGPDVDLGGFSARLQTCRRRA